MGQVAFLLHGIAEHLNEGNIGVAQGAVQALIEMCAGNYNNQLIAFKGQVVISVDIILQENFTSTSVSAHSITTDKEYVYNIKNIKNKLKFIPTD